MPTISIYINKELYTQLQRTNESESKIVQKALTDYFEQLPKTSNSNEIEDNKEEIFNTTNNTQKPRPRYIQQQYNTYDE